MGISHEQGRLWRHQYVSGTPPKNPDDTQNNPKRVEGVLKIPKDWAHVRFYLALNQSNTDQSGENKDLDQEGAGHMAQQREICSDLREEIPFNQPSHKQRLAASNPP